MATMVGNWGGGAIWKVTSGTFPSNCYFCEADVPGGCVLIDAGLDGQTIDAEMAQRGLHPYQVFITHGHFDHAGSADYFQKKYGCQVFMHRGDLRTLKASNFLMMAFKIPHKIKIPEITDIDDRFSTEIAGNTLTYLASPGHTPGSCVIQLGSAWFTGDTIYCSGVGLSSLPGENPGVLRQSIRNLWDGLTCDRKIYPGHGNHSDGEAVRKHNRELLKFMNFPENEGQA